MPPPMMTTRAWVIDARQYRPAPCRGRILTGWAAVLDKQRPPAVEDVTRLSVRSRVRTDERSVLNGSTHQSTPVPQDVRRRRGLVQRRSRACVCAEARADVPLVEPLRPGLGRRAAQAGRGLRQAGELRGAR